jgi:hypothetical protein
MLTLLVLAVVEGPAQGFLAAGARPYIEPAPSALPTSLPANVTLPRYDLPAVERMLRASPTFRQQCARIGRVSSLRVIVSRSMGVPMRSDAATATVVRDGAGRVAEARVFISSAANLVELLAHEFEHILEQLDDIDLPTLASRPDSGVSFDPVTLRYETVRAIAAGEHVAAEVARARR